MYNVHIEYVTYYMYNICIIICLVYILYTKPGLCYIYTSCIIHVYIYIVYILYIYYIYIYTHTHILKKYINDMIYHTGERAQCAAHCNPHKASVQPTHENVHTM